MTAARVQVEEAVGRHEAVGECAAIERGGLVVVFFTLRAPPALNVERAASRERIWGSIFDEAYRAGGSPDDPALHSSAWIDSFTGRPIPSDVMSRIADHTAARILSLAPRRVLEIGCGTGMIAFRVAPSSRSYVACDVAASGLDHVRREAERMGLRNVFVAQRSALELDDLGEPFDCVVVNGTAQYFPSIDYLAEVVRRAARVTRPGGSIFLGELRSLPLVRGFHAALAVARSAETELAVDVRARFKKSLSLEKELAVDPAIGPALVREVPGATSAVVALKRGFDRSELVDVRFDLVVGVGASDVRADPTFRAYDDEPLAELADRAKAGEPVAVASVPNARLSRIREALAWIDSSADSAPRPAFGPDRGVEPEEVHRVASARDLFAHVGWSGDRGDFAFVLGRERVPFSGMARGRTHAELLPLTSFANAPMKDAALEAVVASINEAARAIDPGVTCVRLAALPTDRAILGRLA